MKTLHYRQFYQHLNESTEFWGNRGAGCLFVSRSTHRLLLAHRSDRVNEPNTWGIWGGAIEYGENPKSAAMREAMEESGYDGPMTLLELKQYKNGTFVYHNYLAVIAEEFTPELQWETQDYEWVEYGRWPTPLHFGLKYLIEVEGEKIKKLIEVI